MNQRKDDRSYLSTSGDLETAILMSRNQPSNLPPAVANGSYQYRRGYERKGTPVLFDNLAEWLDREFLRQSNERCVSSHRRGRTGMVMIEYPLYNGNNTSLTNP
jgi:hypothetical protein